MSPTTRFLTSTSTRSPSRTALVRCGSIERNFSITFFRPELLKVAECAGDENDSEEHDAEREVAAVRALNVELELGKTGDERDQTEDAADEHEA